VSIPLHKHIEVIESGYEYLLAYAAQGRADDAGTEARSTLNGMSDAAREIAMALEDGSREIDRVVVNDAGNAGAAIRFVLAQKKISSELVDNLNASIHLRALLTDLFLISEV
jgi:hypothetical protein